MSATTELTTCDVIWTMQPVPVEPADDDPEVAAMLEAMAYRTAMQEALHAIAALARENDRLERRCASLRDELRAARGLS